MIGISFFLAYYEKLSLPGHFASLGTLQEYGWIYMLHSCIVLGALYLSGFYTFGRTINITDTILGVTKSVLIAFIALILVLFSFKVQMISRLFIGLFCLNNALFLILSKIAFKFFITRLHEHGFHTANALVIGTGEIAQRLIHLFNDQPDYGYKVVGCLDPNCDTVGNVVSGIKVFGNTDKLSDILEKRNIDEVFLAMPSNDIQDMNKLIYLCEEVGVRFSIMADWVRPHIAKTVIRTLNDLPVITYTSTPTAVGQLLLKAAIDRIFSAIILILLSPVFLIISIVIRVTSEGPILFRQKRAGLNGRPFTMLKFRTMSLNAEKMREELEGLNEMDGPVFKIKDDPRVTPFGSFLRRTSMDELPQLINVLAGEMSLVGPRPPIPEEVEKYERWQRRRLSMKPGLTCFWQIAGRNEVRFDQWMELDLKYIDNWSLKLDLIILLKTIPVVLSEKGAS